MKRLKTYIPFATNSFQSELAYKGNTFMFFCGQGMLIAVTAFLWRAIYGSSEDAIIKGFDLNQMIIYMLISFLTNLLISSDITSMIYREVKDGSIAMTLIKPISYCKRLMFQCFGQIAFSFVLVFWGAFIAVTVYLCIAGGTFNILNILMYFVSTIFSIFLMLFYRYCFGLLSFKITNMWGLTQIMNAIVRLLSGALIPLTFFPDIIAEIFKYLPFGSMISTPTLIYLGKLNGMEMLQALLLQAVWILVFFGLSKWIWSKLIKHLTILGG